MSEWRYYVAGIFLLILVAGSIILMTWIIPPHTSPVSSPQNDKLAEILARGRIIIATDSSYPPNSEVVANASRIAGTRCAPAEYTASQLRGYNVAVAEGIARQLG